MLHAPDFLGFPSALAMAGTHREAVERGLKLKKIGNRLMATIGGRAIHPVSVRVGGFTRAPREADIEKSARGVDEAIPLAQETVDMVASFTAPSFHREALMVSMKHETDYPYSHGRIVSNRGVDIALNEWDDCFAEQHVEGTNALHARTTDGEVYLLGPSSRVTLAADQLHPLAKEALDRTGLAEEIRTNIYWSIAARAVELLHACRRGARHPRRLQGAVAGPGAVDGEGRPRRVGHRGAARDVLAPLRDRRGRPDRGGADRAADEPEPGPHRGGPSGLRPHGPPPAQARGNPPDRADDPELRPLHQLRDALPGPLDRGGVGPMPAPVLVLACGALDRTDDAAGLLAARALADRLAARGVELEAVGDLSVDDLSERDPATRFVIVDAAYGPAPGEVVRLPFAALPGSKAKPRSSHELPIPEMLGLAELLAGRPLRGELVAIGIASAGFGDVLTPAVEAGMPAFIDAVLAAVEEALGHGGEPDPGGGASRPRPARRCRS